MRIVQARSSKSHRPVEEFIPGEVCRYDGEIMIVTARQTTREIFTGADFELVDLIHGKVYRVQRGTPLEIVYAEVVVHKECT